MVWITLAKVMTALLYVGNVSLWLRNYRFYKSYYV